MTAKLARAEAKLGEPLAAWIARHRRDGMGWIWIAIELGRLTEVQVSEKELEDWYKLAQVSITYQVDPFTLCQ